MALYSFEGEIDNITERQLQFINGVILELGLKNNKVFFEPVGIAGDNYVANVKRITVDAGHQSFNIIAKIAPSIGFIRKTMNTDIMFRNEHIMYTEVLPKLVQLQEDANIPKEQQLRYAKCYGSLSEESHEVILLEDLKVSNFTVLDRFLPLPNVCVKSVLKNFAILHSLSFVLKHKEEETYNKFKDSLIGIWSLTDKLGDLKVYFQAIENDTIAIIKDQKYIDYLRDKVANTTDSAVKCSEIDNVSKYTVIQQGDSWTNNIMFKFEGDKFVESVMIDYQISKNTSPVCDLMYMIFNCTDHETRQKEFYDWIDYYHTELEKSLSNFDLPVNLVYPRSRLDYDLKQYGKFIFGQAILIASVLIRKSNDAAKIKEAMNSENLLEQTQELLVSSLDEESKALFRKRVIGLIESFTQFELL